MERSAEKGSTAMGERYNLYLLDEQCAQLVPSLQRRPGMG